MISLELAVIFFVLGWILFVAGFVLHDKFTTRFSRMFHILMVISLVWATFYGFLTVAVYLGLVNV